MKTLLFAKRRARTHEVRALLAELTGEHSNEACRAGGRRQSAAAAAPVFCPW